MAIEKIKADKKELESHMESCLELFIIDHPEVEIMDVSVGFTKLFSYYKKEPEYMNPIVKIKISI